MKNFMSMLDDLWVAVAFSEAGEYPPQDALQMRRVKTAGSARPVKFATGG